MIPALVTEEASMERPSRSIHQQVFLSHGALSFSSPLDSAPRMVFFETARTPGGHRSVTRPWLALGLRLKAISLGAVFLRFLNTYIRNGRTSW